MDCIHGPMPVAEIRAVPEALRSEQLSGVQMFVNPKECIGCWACIPVCPVNAIFEDSEVPDHWQHYIGENARFFESQ
jgi:NAD-dependent dihydropyrimidine dehydrogenase PreA subunit